MRAAAMIKREWRAIGSSVCGEKSLLTVIDGRTEATPLQ
jgi:hypothetical protein